MRLHVSVPFISDTDNERIIKTWSDIAEGSISETFYGSHCTARSERSLICSIL